MSARRGFALITVLWIALLLGLFAAGVSEVARRGGQAALIEEQGTQANALLDLALARAVWAIKRQDTAESVQPNGLIFTDSVGTGQIALRITPADSLIDLNSAGAVLFDALAVNTPVRDSEALSLALQTQAGIVGAVQDLARLGVAQDVSRPVIQSLSLLTTVYSGMTAPDLTRAPKEILMRVPGLTDLQVEAILFGRRNGVELPIAAAPEWSPSPTERRPIGPVYHIELAARGLTGLQRARMVVVFLPLPETRPIVPYYILESWDIPGESPLLDALSERP